MDLNKPLRGDDAFQVTLLSTCEATHNIMKQRLTHETDRKKKEKREYWLEKLYIACQALGSTFDGYVSQEFERRFVKYHKWVEMEMNNLLKECEGLNK